MKKATLILLGLAVLAYASIRSPDKTKPSRFQHLKGWQKIFGVLAVVLTLLIILNPEFLALGLIGSSAFFDLLVLAMGLQLQTVAARAWGFVTARFAKSMRAISLEWCVVSCCLVTMVATSVSAIQKAVHRILS